MPGETAHVVTLQALFALYQKAFIQSTQEDSRGVADLSKEVTDACTQATNDGLKETNYKLLKAVEQHGLVVT